MRIPSWTLLLLSLGMMVGCFPRGDPSRPIPTALVAASEKARRLVVVLPGRADDLDDLRASGMAQAVQSAWPDADVVLTGLALGFYLEGRAEQRLQDEVIAPARARGYAQIWLVGASLGGMGALLHHRRYPGGVDGMVLLAPYLGESAAQGLLLEHLDGLRRDPARAANLWLAYGKSDRLRSSMPLLEPLLPPGQVLVRDGGHDWEFWSPATGELLRRADARRGAGVRP